MIGWSNYCDSESLLDGTCVFKPNGTTERYGRIIGYPSWFVTDELDRRCECTDVTSSVHREVTEDVLLSSFVPKWEQKPLTLLLDSQTVQAIYLTSLRHKRADNSDDDDDDEEEEEEEREIDYEEADTAGKRRCNGEGNTGKKRKSSKEMAKSRSKKNKKKRNGRNRRKDDAASADRDALSLETDFAAVGEVMGRIYNLPSPIECIMDVRCVDLAYSLTVGGRRFLFEVLIPIVRRWVPHIRLSLDNNECPVSKMNDKFSNFMNALVPTLFSHPLVGYRNDTTVVVTERQHDRGFASLEICDYCVYPSQLLLPAALAGSAVGGVGSVGCSAGVAGGGGAGCFGRYGGGAVSSSSHFAVPPPGYGRWRHGRRFDDGVGGGAWGDRGSVGLTSILGGCSFESSSGLLSALGGSARGGGDGCGLTPDNVRAMVEHAFARNRHVTRVNVGHFKCPRNYKIDGVHAETLYVHTRAATRAIAAAEMALYGACGAYGTHPSSSDCYGSGRWRSGAGGGSHPGGASGGPRYPAGYAVGGAGLLPYPYDGDAVAQSCHYNQTKRLFVLDVPSDAVWAESVWLCRVLHVEQVYFLVPEIDHCRVKYTALNMSTDGYSFGCSGSSSGRAGGSCGGGGGGMWGGYSMAAAKFPKVVDFGFFCYPSIVDGVEKLRCASPGLGDPWYNMLSTLSAPLELECNKFDRREAITNYHRRARRALDDVSSDGVVAVVGGGRGLGGQGGDGGSAVVASEDVDGALVDASGGGAERGVVVTVGGRQGVGDHSVGSGCVGGTAGAGGAGGSGSSGSAVWWDEGKYTKQLMRRITSARITSVQDLLEVVAQSPPRCKNLGICDIPAHHMGSSVVDVKMVDALRNSEVMLEKLEQLTLSVQCDQSLVDTIVSLLRGKVLRFLRKLHLYYTSDPDLLRVVMSSVPTRAKNDAAAKQRQQMNGARGVTCGGFDNGGQYDARGGEFYGHQARPPWGASMEGRWGLTHLSISVDHTYDLDAHVHAITTYCPDIAERLEELTVIVRNGIVNVRESIADVFSHRGRNCIRYMYLYVNAEHNNFDTLKCGEDELRAMFPQLVQIISPVLWLNVDFTPIPPPSRRNNILTIFRSARWSAVDKKSKKSKNKKDNDAGCAGNAKKRKCDRESRGYSVSSSSARDRSLYPPDHTRRPRESRDRTPFDRKESARVTPNTLASTLAEDLLAPTPLPSRGVEDDDFVPARVEPSATLHLQQLVCRAPNLFWGTGGSVIGESTATENEGDEEQVVEAVTTEKGETRREWRETEEENEGGEHPSSDTIRTAGAQSDARRLNLDQHPETTHPIVDTSGGEDDRNYPRYYASDSANDTELRADDDSDFRDDADRMLMPPPAAPPPRAVSRNTIGSASSKSSSSSSTSSSSDDDIVLKTQAGTELPQHHEKYAPYPPPTPHTNTTPQPHPPPPHPASSTDVSKLPVSTRYVDDLNRVTDSDRDVMRERAKRCRDKLLDGAMARRNRHAARETKDGAAQSIAAGPATSSGSSSEDEQQETTTNRTAETQQQRHHPNTARVVSKEELANAAKVTRGAEEDEKDGMTVSDDVDESSREQRRREIAKQLEKLMAVNKMIRESDGDELTDANVESAFRMMDGTDISDESSEGDDDITPVDDGVPDVRVGGFNRRIESVDPREDEYGEGYDGLAPATSAIRSEEEGEGEGEGEEEGEEEEEKGTTVADDDDGEEWGPKTQSQPHGGGMATDRQQPRSLVDRLLRDTSTYVQMKPPDSNSSAISDSATYVSSSDIGTIAGVGSSVSKNMSTTSNGIEGGIGTRGLMMGARVTGHSGRHGGGRRAGAEGTPYYSSEVAYDEMPGNVSVADRNAMQAHLEETLYGRD